jgi:hypothetical protein
MAVAEKLASGLRWMDVFCGNLAGSRAPEGTMISLMTAWGHSLQNAMSASVETKRCLNSSNPDEGFLPHCGAQE